jgi:hypothetical protein
MVSMVTILLIVPISTGKKMMTRRKASITRKKLMVRHTLARDGTPMMRALTPIVMVSSP